VRAQTVPALPKTEAWILVDADSGQVLAAQSHHEAKPPASTTKLMTALVAMEKLPNHSSIPVGPGAAAQPAMRIGMGEGQVWPLDDAIKSLMLVSANDAAYALAEAASGSLEGFAADMNAAAARYGMQDSVFNDPAGFDDSASFNGGSKVSAYDLAIAARNFLAVPELANLARLTEYHFDGPDNREHHLYNHNKLLKRYPGAIGLKTGFTRRAGHTFVGAATRDGRTMIAVVLRSDNIYGASSALLDMGFATPRGATGTGETLPNTRVRLYQPPSALGTIASRAMQLADPGDPVPETTGTAKAEGPGAAEAAELTAAGTVRDGGGGGGWLAQVAMVFGGSALGVALLRRRAIRRQRARQARRRRLGEARRAESQRLGIPDDWDGIDLDPPMPAPVPADLSLQ
jgi:D-alanyl-D-alanine carboxypeptidase (penicillin-binding protein 5/6)